MLTFAHLTFADILTPIPVSGRHFKLINDGLLPALAPEKDKELCSPMEQPVAAANE